MSVEVVCERFSTTDGLALLHRRWSASGERGALAIVHGLAEHSARYQHVARFFAERGWSVHGYDQRGHGESEGRRVYTPSFEQLLDDAETFLERVRATDDATPLVLLGHSMGGLEVASLLSRRRPAVDAAVLSGAALAPGEGFGALTRLLIAVLGRLAPRLRLPSSLDAEGLSRDPEVVAAYLADPLVDKRYSARLVSELLGAITAIEAGAAAVEVPLLVVHGEDDPLCPVDGSRRFVEQVTTPGSEFRSYTRLRHEVLNEPEREQVMNDIAAWLDKHVARA